MIGKASLCPKYRLLTSGLELEEKSSSSGRRHSAREGKLRVAGVGNPEARW